VPWRELKEWSPTRLWGEGPMALFLVEEGICSSIHRLDFPKVEQHLMVEKFIVEVLKTELLVSSQDGDRGDEVVEGGVQPTSEINDEILIRNRFANDSQLVSTFFGCLVVVRIAFRASVKTMELFLKVCDSGLGLVGKLIGQGYPDLA
jgi:hypothetical protein